MSDFFEKLEKYKFGLLAALIAYVGIFAYFQIGTYNGGGAPYNPFEEGARIEIPEDEIKLLPENIMLPANFDPSDVKNAVRDANDDRKRSETNFSNHKPISDGAQAAKDFEEKLKNEAAGVAERADIEARDAARKEREKQQAKNNAKSDKPSTSGNTSNTASAGKVLVEPYLAKRSSTRAEIPGYMCGIGASGKVVMIVKVDNAGTVISATHDPSQNQGNVDYCMIQQAQKYAMRSRFQASSSAVKSQEGWIAYTFISQ